MNKKIITIILIVFCVASTIAISVWGSIPYGTNIIRVESIEIINPEKEDLKCDVNDDGEKIIELIRGTKTYQIEYQFNPTEPTDRTVYFDIISGKEYATIDDKGFITFNEEQIVTVRLYSNLDDGKHDIVLIMFKGNTGSNITDDPFE